MVLGLEGVVRIKTNHFPGTVLKPVIINQEILENIFCQVRGSSGLNDNPNYYLYGGVMPSVNMGQTVISKKDTQEVIRAVFHMSPYPTFTFVLTKCYYKKNHFQFSG